VDVVSPEEVLARTTPFSPSWRGSRWQGNDRDDERIIRQPTAEEAEEAEVSQLNGLLDVQHDALNEQEVIAGWLHLNWFPPF
jgi:hypothetical protein